MFKMQYCDLFRTLYNIIYMTITMLGHSIVAKEWQKMSLVIKLYFKANIKDHMLLINMVHLSLILAGIVCTMDLWPLLS